MILNRMLGVPSVGTGRQRWIDNHGELNANNCVRDLTRKLSVMRVTEGEYI